jgi:crotonobetainyl-CoA:carnitine CoA-transferase CaiB-like acyl-CoA transferase
MHIGDDAAMLSGIKILDLTSVVFGPYATQILTDLGAEVIKVESPSGGDQLRWSAKAAATPGMSPAFMAINRGKRSVALDLKQPDDLAKVKALIADTDVMILNIRGKALERLALDYDSVRSIQPEIIYVHCVGFGQDGPYADLQAYDDVIQAASGATSLLGRVDGNPAARYLPSLIADKVAGLHAAYATQAAIIHKLRTGRGQHVEVPMFEAFTSFMLVEHLAGLTFDPPVGDVCYSRQIDPDRQPFPTRDGFISIVAYTDEAWPRLFALLGEPELLNDERYCTRRLRVTNMPDLYQAVARLTPGFSTEELLAACRAAQIPAQPARDIREIMGDTHLAATGFFERLQHPTEGAYFATRPPVRFSDAEAPAHLPPPTLGQHTAEIA